MSAYFIDVSVCNGNGNHLLNRPHFHTVCFFSNEHFIIEYLSLQAQLLSASTALVTPCAPQLPFESPRILIDFTLASLLKKTIPHTYTVLSTPPLPLGQLYPSDPFALGIFSPWYFSSDVVFVVVDVSSMLFPYFWPCFSPSLTRFEFISVQFRPHSRHEQAKKRSTPVVKREHKMKWLEMDGMTKWTGRRKKNGLQKKCCRRRTSLAYTLELWFI